MLGLILRVNRPNRTDSPRKCSLIVTRLLGWQPIVMYLITQWDRIPCSVRYGRSAPFQNPSDEVGIPWNDQLAFPSVGGCWTWLKQWWGPKLYEFGWQRVVEMHCQCEEARCNHQRAYRYMHWQLVESHFPGHLMMVWVWGIGIGDPVRVHARMIGVSVSVMVQVDGPIFFCYGEHRTFWTKFVVKGC